MTVVFGALTGVLIVGVTAMMLSGFIRSGRKAWLVLTLAAVLYIWIMGDALIPHFVGVMEEGGGFWFFAGVIPGAFLAGLFVRLLWKKYFHSMPADRS